MLPTPKPTHPLPASRRSPRCDSHSKHLSQKKHQRGFSLIELLAAMACIGVLAAILIPAVSKVRLSADKVDATQMIRQLGVYIQLYVNDNDGLLPATNTNNQYAVLPEKTSGQLAWSLRGYVDEEPVQGARPIVRVMGYQRFFNNYDPTTTPALSLSSRVIVSEESGIRQNPFGKGGPPLEYHSIPFHGSQAAMTHLDRLTMNDAGSTLGGDKAAAEPPLGDGRMVLFFDWHVEFKPLDYKIGTWNGPGNPPGSN